MKLYKTSVIKGLRKRSCGCCTTQCEYLLKVQHVMDRTRAFFSDKLVIKYGINSGK